MVRELKNPYTRPDHRQAFDLAVSLYQSGVTDFHIISQQLDHAIEREKRNKIAAKVARLMGGHKPSRAGTPPNTSVVLSDKELSFIKDHYGGEKSRAIHDGLALLMNQAP